MGLIRNVRNFKHTLAYVNSNRKYYNSNDTIKFEINKLETAIEEMNFDIEKIISKLESIRDLIKENRQRFISFMVWAMGTVLASFIVLGTTCVWPKTDENSRLRHGLSISLAAISLIGTLFIACVWYYLESWDLRGSNFNSVTNS